MAAIRAAKPLSAGAGVSPLKLIQKHLDLFPKLRSFTNPQREWLK
jgi:hypothetical protein